MIQIKILHENFVNHELDDFEKKNIQDNGKVKSGNVQEYIYIRCISKQLFSYRLLFKRIFIS